MMKRSVKGWIVAVAVLVTGCAGGNENANTSGTGTTTTTTTGAGGANAGGAGATGATSAQVTPVPIVPLRVTAGAPDGGAGHVAELRADGGLYADGQLAARFDGRVLSDAQGNEVFRIGADGAITTPRDSSGRAHLTANGEVVTADSRIVVGDDGSVEERHNDGRVERAPMRLEGMTPEGRRAGAVFTLWLLEARAAPSPTPSVSVGPGAGLDGGAGAGADASASTSADAGHDAGRRRRR